MKLTITIELDGEQDLRTAFKEAGERLFGDNRGSEDAYHSFQNIEMGKALKNALTVLAITDTDSLVGRTWADIVFIRGMGPGKMWDLERIIHPWGYFFTHDGETKAKYPENRFSYVKRLR